MNNQSQNGAREVAAALINAKSVAIFMHVNPDGDTIGSALALRLALISLGKRAEVFCQDAMPRVYRYLEGIKSVKTAEGVSPSDFDLAVSTDVSDIERMGDLRGLFSAIAKCAQIDHHETNPMFADFNYVDGMASATAYLVYEMLSWISAPLTCEIAVCLYTGVSTDTGNFMFRNTDDRAFEMMPALMRAGLPLTALSSRLFREMSRSHVLLLGKALKSIRYIKDGKIAVMTLSQAEMDECGAKPEHADGVVNFGIDTEGVYLASLARESSGKTKFSLRAKEPCSAARVALRFGGGGHELAAGCTIDAPLIEAAMIMEKALIEELSGAKPPEDD
ncbi:MAG: bifunctional oligoribonuclease/PAP phosphatase NrnA [Eubacteriales bacterium]|nr:bifunctional oligoribonuclease/PAP phosphatase NrnA [Eubacteriales bacterium]MDD3882304.1 bifunctional oligoribonuclease/PAP phosphatase NrnA [Eubacteriales bacterium]MDD4512050.1 bifunctional oligoribonuclease/PAP phosphatase NrnA [Eubacteriales bacterium]